MSAQAEVWTRYSVKGKNEGEIWKGTKIYDEVIPGIHRKDLLRESVLRQLFMSIIHHAYQNSTHIYTDGSTVSAGSAAGVVLSMHGVSHQLKLGHRTTSTASE